MKKYAKIIDSETKICQVALGDDVDYYKSHGFTELEVTKAYNGDWYLQGYEPRPSYKELRIKEYPSISEQLDMLYWDKMNGTENWKNKITEIKSKYPKE